jgi:multisubunit Na+/H+ antiporter MnhB subunit
MNGGGMTPIVKNVTRLVTGFIAVFAVYIALTGHLSPGGGFAGGVILAAAAVLVVLAFGREFASKLISEPICHVADAGGALGFLLVALCGYFAGTFFINFLQLGRVGEFWSGGTILLSNLAILIKVGAGLAGVFIALAAFRRVIPNREI